MNNRYEQIAGFWNNEARYWAEDNPLHSLRQPVANFVKHHMETLVAHVPPNGIILDLGSGTDSALYYRHNTQRVISLDVSHNMLRYNKGQYKVEMDLCRPLPIASNSVDACLSVMVMRYLKASEHIQLFKEIWRVLKVNGSFLIMDLQGNNEYQHQYTSFSAEKLKPLVLNTGFENVTVINENIGSGEWIISGFESAQRNSREYEGISGMKKNSVSHQYDIAVEEKYLKNERENMMQFPPKKFGF